MSLEYNRAGATVSWAESGPSKTSASFSPDDRASRTQCHLIIYSLHNFDKQSQRFRLVCTNYENMVIYA